MPLDSLVYADCRYAECHYSKCHYAECHYIERHYTECHYTECHYAECHYAECHYAECYYAECHYTECRGATGKACQGQIFTLAYSSQSINAEDKKVLNVDFRLMPATTNSTTTVTGLSTAPRHSA